MAPQQKKNSKKTASPKKIPAKKTALKKAGSKKLSSKTTPNKKIAASKKMSPQKKKTAPKKTVPKKPANKKPAPKKAALKKKIESKRTAKVGQSVAKENAQGKKMAISKGSEERTARASRRSLAKAAPAAKEPQRKRARLDGSSDLVNLLTTSAPVLDIIAASGSRPFPKEAMEVTYITKC